TYKSLNKLVFQVKVNYAGRNFVFNLRKQTSINAINSLTSNWKFYTSLFAVQSGMDESFGSGESKINNFSINSNGDSISFPIAGQVIGTFSWNEKLTLIEIEQMKGYKVKPRGIVSQFKHGGFVVFEENGHGLVAAVCDIGRMILNDAKAACDELVLNGYSDWYLPSNDELRYMDWNLGMYGIGGLDDNYCSSTESAALGTFRSSNESNKCNVRPVRVF
ncbi:MAG: hypothetical protein ABL927_14215, partial [Bdellovibrionales bacterium]